MDTLSLRSLQNSQHVFVPPPPLALALRVLSSPHCSEWTGILGILLFICFCLFIVIVVYFRCT